MTYDTKKLVSRFQASGLSQKRFCQKHSVAFSTLQYHLHKSKKGQSSDSGLGLPGFIPLKVSPPAEAISAVTIIRGSFSLSGIAELIKSFEF